MKESIIKDLRELEGRLRKLRSLVKENDSDRIRKRTIRDEAAAVADFWVERIRSPLEYRFHVQVDTIEAYATGFKHLHVLSRPNNRRSSYLATLDDLLMRYADRLILPLQQFAEPADRIVDLLNMVRGLSDVKESEYLREALECAARGFRRASVVLGWCAAMDRIQRKIQNLGFEKFNAASARMKGQTSGRFRRFNKEFRIASLSELQEVFDADVLWILEGMGFIDSNEGDRLREVDFVYRNQSAHPGRAPVEDAHLVAFFTDLNEIVLSNPKFLVT